MKDMKNEQGHSDRLASVSMIIAAFPPGVWYVGTFIVVVILIALAWVFRDNLQTIIKVIGFVSVGIASLALIRHVSKSVTSTRIEWEHSNIKSLERQQKKASVSKAHLNNVKLQLEIETAARYLPRMIEQSIESGRNYKYMGFEATHHLSNLHTLQSGDTQVAQISEHASLPSLVRYEDIRHQIPEGHNVVGIAGTGLITKEDRHIGACVWIIGGSGSGKTSTTSLRLEERSNCGHQFYGVDPHWFKDDSLTNAVVGFSDRFLLPMARDTRETKHVLETFLKQFQDRKAGKVEKPFQKITLVVDEVGSLNDPQCEEEEEVLKLLKTITRVCGQEARNFNMGGIFISQQATGLYWIGNVALLVVVHKLIKENQQKLATQTDDKDLFASMRLWPKGRSYVYGMGLEEGEGCLVLQQPYFEKHAEGQWVYPDESQIVDTNGNTSEPLPFPVARKQSKRAEHVNLSDAIAYWNEVSRSKGRVPTVKEIEEVYSLTNHQARRLINDFILATVDASTETM